MAKTKTSAKRAKSSTGKLRKLKKKNSTRPYDPSAKLRDAKYVREALDEAFADGDLEALRAIVRAHLRVLKRSKTAIAQKLGVSRQTIHNVIKEKGKDPGIEFIVSVRAALNKRAWRA